MTTVGGAISGYCAIGSTCDEISPANVMMIEITPAKIGRLMKNSEKPIGDGLPVSGYLAGAVVGTAAGAGAGGASVTGMPGRTLSRLSTITRSPVLSPDTMAQSDPIQSPVWTGCACALPWASTTKTRCAFSVWITAVCGTRKTLSRWPAAMLTVTN